jgi:beta-N-acetylhexosaminidase
MQRLASVLVVALVFLAGSARAAAPMAASTVAGTATTGMTTAAGTTATLATTAAPTLTQMIGQKLVVRMDGLTPSADLLGRIRRGEIGGVILFGFNITTRSALIALTSQLRAAAAGGGQPRLLIAVDQEGGSIKRIPWAPPTLSPPQMGAIGSSTTAHSQGAMAGAALKGLGVNVDFAPVADVPSSTASFMYRAGRTWSFSSTVTAALSDAFASGLRSTGVIPSMKHFPGIGRSPYDTDGVAVTFWSSAATLAPELRPYRLAISHHIPMIMLSNGRYMAYDTVNGAGWSHAISVDLLRGQLGFTGVTITDALSGAAYSRGLATWTLAVRAARAGTDMILVTGSERSTRYIYSKLMAYATSGWISRTALASSYHRILALKDGL